MNTRRTDPRIRVVQPSRVSAFTRLSPRARVRAPSDVVLNKFRRLAQIERVMTRNKRLYTEHDQLVADLLPLFIRSNGNQIIINREITIGTQRFRLTPGFLESSRGIKATTWKSTAFKNFLIESL